MAESNTLASINVIMRRISQNCLVSKEGIISPALGEIRIAHCEKVCNSVFVSLYTILIISFSLREKSTTKLKIFWMVDAYIFCEMIARRFCQWLKDDSYTLIVSTFLREDVLSWGIGSVVECVCTDQLHKITDHEFLSSLSTSFINIAIESYSAANDRTVESEQQFCYGAIYTKPCQMDVAVIPQVGQIQYHDARLVSDFFHRYFLLCRALIVPLAMGAFLVCFEDVEPGNKRQHLSPGSTWSRGLFLHLPETCWGRQSFEPWLRGPPSAGGAPHTVSTGPTSC